MNRTANNTRTRRRNAAASMSTLLALCLGLVGVNSSEVLAQVQWQIVGADATIQGDAFANEIPITGPAGVSATCALVGPGGVGVPFLPSVMGSGGVVHEFGRKCFGEAKDESLAPPVWTQAVIKARAFIDGDNTNEVTIQWLNLTYCDQDTDGHVADAEMSLTFAIDLKITNGPVGTPVLVYYYWDAFGGATTHHDCLDTPLHVNCPPNNWEDDPVRTVNTLTVGGAEVLAGRFDFASPGGLPGWNQKKKQSGFIASFVGDTITIDLDSFCEAHLMSPEPVGNSTLPEADAMFTGTLRITVGTWPPPPPPPEVEPLLLFSLDIGSDSELSDPNFDGDEVFDPGDCYAWQGAGLPVCGDNGILDDANIFAGLDFMPTPPDCPPALSAAPVCGGLPPSDYFDLDGTDSLDFSVSMLLGPLPGSIDFFPSDCIYSAENLVISFDDDSASHYADPASCSVPVNAASPYGGDTYGQAARRDEVIYVRVTGSATSSTAAPVFAVPFANEGEVHVNLLPNPTAAQAGDDDDVDALDLMENADLCGYWYFSSDHEATVVDPNSGLQIDPGDIYEVDPAMGLVPYAAVEHGAHLGLQDGVDIDAFEFVWLYGVGANGIGNVRLALLFSVDDDDPVTPENESGGLDPRIVYASFLDGATFQYVDVPFGDDVDALATWQTSLVPPSTTGACCGAGMSGCQIIDATTCAALGGTYRGNGSDCADANLNGLPDVCECLYCKGDLNADGKVNAMDIKPFIECLTGGASFNCGCADLDADGTLDAGDVSLFVLTLLHGPLLPCP